MNRKRSTAGIPGNCLKKSRTDRITKLRKAQMERRQNKNPPLILPAEEINRLGHKIPPYNREHIRDPIAAIGEYGSYDEYIMGQYKRQIDTSGMMGGYPGEDEWEDWQENEPTVFRRTTKKPTVAAMTAMKEAVESQNKPVQTDDGSS
jgi:hypothetical protein